jgi:hypothetical protein
MQTGGIQTAVAVAALERGCTFNESAPPDKHHWIVLKPIRRRPRLFFGDEKWNNRRRIPEFQSPFSRSSRRA